MFGSCKGLCFFSLLGLSFFFQESAFFLALFFFFGRRRQDPDSKVQVEQSVRSVTIALGVFAGIATTVEIR